MTNIEELAVQMEFGDETRRRLAEELTRLRRLEEVCKVHRVHLPHQVQTALRAPALEVERDAPMPGTPGLFQQGSHA